MRRIKWLVLAVTIVMMLASLAAAPAETAEVRFKNVSVHDPSVLRTEDGRFYIYGSHMQAAWSDDLVNWKMFSKLDKCALQPEYAVEFNEAMTWAQTGTFWAPDVIQLADGRYYMYYCCCEGSSPLSALGLAGNPATTRPGIPTPSTPACFLMPAVSGCTWCTAPTPGAFFCWSWTRRRA